MKIGKKPEPVIVAKMWDDLCLGVICQSNPEIAGSPRNIFRYSGLFIDLGGRALDGLSSLREIAQSNSEYQDYYRLVSPARLSESGRAGEQPKLPIKAPKFWLSCKGSKISTTPRRLA